MTVADPGFEIENAPPPAANQVFHAPVFAA